MGRGKDYPREMLDWIQFLISIRSHIYTLIAGMLTFFSIAILLYIWYHDRADFIGLIGMTVIAILFIVIVCVFYLLNYLNKLPTKLLNKIMIGEIKNPEEVKDMWFKKKKQQLSNLRLVSYFSMSLGLGFVIFASIAATVGFSTWQLNSQFAGAGMTLFMLGIALLALDFSRESDIRLTKLGKESNEKLTTISNATFMEIADIFEDKRIQLWGFIRKNKFKNLDETTEIIEITCWKCKTYSFRALKLVETTDIDEENQNKFFQQLELLLKNSGLPWDGVEQKSKEKNGRNKKILYISEKDSKNLIQACDDVLEFNISEDQKKKIREFISGMKDYLMFIKKVSK